MVLRGSGKLIANICTTYRGLADSILNTRFDKAEPLRNHNDNLKSSYMFCRFYPCIIKVPNEVHGSFWLIVLQA